MDKADLKMQKSIKQKLDEKIQDDKKAGEDILKRYDNFLDKMNLNTIE